MWALWTFVVVVTLIGGLLLAFCGEGRHIKQLAMHGTILLLENRPLRLICSVNLPLLLPAIPLPSSLPPSLELGIYITCLKGRASSSSSIYKSSRLGNRSGFRFLVLLVNS